MMEMRKTTNLPPPAKQLDFRHLLNWGLFGFTIQSSYSEATSYSSILSSLIIIGHHNPWSSCNTIGLQTLFLLVYFLLRSNHQIHQEMIIKRDSINGWRSNSWLWKCVPPTQRLLQPKHHLWNASYVLFLHHDYLHYHNHDQNVFLHNKGHRL